MLASTWLMKEPMHTVPTTIHRYATRCAIKGIAGGARPLSTASRRAPIDAALGNTVCVFSARRGELAAQCGTVLIKYRSASANARVVVNFHRVREDGGRKVSEITEDGR